MTGPELMAKVIAELLTKDEYSGVELEGDTIYILRQVNPEWFKIKITVEKKEKKLGLLHPET